ncbi:MAG: CDP-alcohol phosphatidyltransferase family protein [Chloroflexota bacterium]|nr:CDP-alcohol phosphatidyltransferase family protein [Chloroflexota bacterium]
MISDWARGFFRGFLEAVARFFQRLGVTPNQLTIIGLMLQAVVAVVIALGYLPLAGILLVLFSIFDAFDGTLARMTGRASTFGSFLDSTIDRYAEAIVLFGLLVYMTGIGDRTGILLIYVSIVGSLLVSYTRAKAESLDIECKVGILTRAERIIVLVIGLVFSGWHPFPGGPGVLILALWVLAIFSNVTAIQRVYAVWKATESERN